MTASRIRLGVNIDHVATVRNARGGVHPDPARAARLAEQAGADGLTFHLREDRRHIRDTDLAAIRSAVSLPINMEMAASDEMVAIAEGFVPETAMFVPEKRAELTTEGGLDAARHHITLSVYVRRMQAAGSRVSFFIDPEEDQVRAAADMGVEICELHTGPYVEAVQSGVIDDADLELGRLRKAAGLALKLGLEPQAGHGLTFDTVGPVAAIPELTELNIGHFLIGEAVFVGLETAIKEMRARMDAARA